MKELLQHLRPVAPNVPLLNPYPMAARIENTRFVTYFKTDEARIERAAALLLDGVRVVMLPKVLAS
jgi:hypothetical protein